MPSSLGNSTGSLALCVLPHQMSQAPSVLPPDTISARESISGDLRPRASPRSSQEAPFSSCQPPVRTAEWQCGEAWLLGLGFGLSLGSDLSLLVLSSCSSARPISWGLHILVVACIESGGLKDLSQTVIGAAASYCEIQGLFLTLC